MDGGAESISKSVLEFFHSYMNAVAVEVGVRMRVSFAVVVGADVNVHFGAV